MKILLIEPETSGKFVPLGLLKIAAHALNLGHTVHLLRINKDGYPNIGHFDKAYVTSLYTWEWKSVWKAVKYAKLHADKVYLGGIYASLVPEHAEQSGAKVIPGVIEELEYIRPAYHLVPDCDYSIVHMSRGCVRSCEFCAVPKIEGRLREKPASILRKLVHPKHNKIILLDNNLLAIKHWDELWLELRRLNKLVDPHGIDARLIDEKKAEQLSKLRLRADEHTSLRLGFDDIRYRKHAERAARLLQEHGINGRRIMFYVLYNFNDTPDDFFERVRLVNSWFCVAFPMRYQSINLPHCLTKNSYISPNWTKEELDMVDEFVWKYGRGASLPPYLYPHFEKSKDFYEAFSSSSNKLTKLTEFIKNGGGENGDGGKK